MCKILISRRQRSPHDRRDTFVEAVKMLWGKCRSTEERRTRVHTYADLALILKELALDCQQEIQFDGICKLANDSNPQTVTHKQNAQLKLIKNCSLFYNRGHGDNGDPIHAEDCTC